MGLKYQCPAAARRAVCPASVGGGGGRTSILDLGLFSRQGSANASISTLGGVKLPHAQATGRDLTSWAAIQDPAHTCLRGGRGGRGLSSIKVASSSMKEICLCLLAWI